MNSWMDEQVPLQTWPAEDESIHGCRTNTTHCTALAVLAPASLWEFCELPAPCMGSAHHGPLVLQAGGCKGRSHTQTRAWHSLVCIQEKQGVRGSTSLFSSCYQAGGKWTHGTPLLSTWPIPAPLCASPACVPVTAGSAPCSPWCWERAALPGRGISVAAEQDRGALSLGTLIRQWGEEEGKQPPLKQASLCPICLAERKEPPGAAPAPQETIPSLYPPPAAPLQGISFPWLKYKQTNSTKCSAPILPCRGRIHPANLKPTWSPAPSSSGSKAAPVASAGGRAPTGFSHLTAPLLPALCHSIPGRWFAAA